MDEVDIWVMPNEVLRAALEQAAAGEPVDMILLNLYAHCRVKTAGDD